MTVLHVIHRSGTGGLETLLLRLLPLLPRTYRSDVLVLQGTGDLHRAFKKAAHRLITPEGAGRFSKYLRWWLVLRAYRNEIIHFHHTGPLPLWLSRFAGCRKVIYHVHGTREEKNVWKRRATAWMWKLCKKLPSIYIANSHTTREVLIDQRFPIRRIRVIHNGVDFGVFRPGAEGEWGKWPENASGRKVILYAGRFTEGKNLFQWLDVAHQVYEAKRDVFFVLAGDGPIRPIVEDYAKSLNLEGCCWFPGFCDRMELLLNRSDLFLFLSSWESFGLAVLEAIACGVPVLVSDIPAMRELLGDGSGHILNATETHSTALQVMEVLNAPEAWREDALKQRAELSKRYEITETRDRLVELYQQIASNPSAPG